MTLGCLWEGWLSPESEMLRSNRDFFSSVAALRPGLAYVAGGELYYWILEGGAAPR